MAGRGELDAPRLWRSARRAAPGGPRVLVGLPRAELWTEIRPGTWEALLELFRVAFPVTVVDAGFCLEEDEELLYDQVRLRRNAVTRLAIFASTTDTWRPSGSMQQPRRAQCGAAASHRRLSVSTSRWLARRPWPGRPCRSGRGHRPGTPTAGGRSR
jgi:hypothetical protein